MKTRHIAIILAIVLVSVGMVGIFANIIKNTQDQIMHEEWQEKRESLLDSIKKDKAEEDVKSIESNSQTNTSSDYPSSVQCSGNKLCLAEEIVRIVDGDTIVLKGGHKIRLSLTNTPEIYQSGFDEATKFTAKLCPVGTIAVVDQDDLQPFDVYDRLLGKVVCGGKTLNSELLYSGHANILTQYCTTSEFSSEIWAKDFGC